MNDPRRRWQPCLNEIGRLHAGREIFLDALRHMAPAGSCCETSVDALRRATALGARR